MRRSSRIREHSACSPLEARSEAAELRRQLVRSGVIGANVHCNDELLVAAAAAVRANAREQSDLLPWLPRGQKSERLRVWVRHLRALADLPSADPVVPKRVRSASDLAAASVPSAVINPESGLPAQPRKWQLLRARDVGAAARSPAAMARAIARMLATAATTETAGAPQQLRLQLDDFASTPRRRLPDAAAALTSPLPDYLRIALDGEPTRRAIARITLGVVELADLAPMPVAVGTEQAAVPAARLGWSVESLGSIESCGQLWLSTAASTCATHFDLPTSVLVVLAGAKSVALLPPAAPYKLGLAHTDSASKLETRYSLLGEKRVDVCAVRTVVDLEPGDAVYIPSGWWHQIRSAAGTVALSLPVARCADFELGSCSREAEVEPREPATARSRRS